MFHSGSRFLLVDDFEVVRLMLRQSLDRLGFTRIDEAWQPELAWQMLERAARAGEPYDAVFCAIEALQAKPGERAANLLDQLRSHDAMSETPFLIVSARPEMKPVIHALQSGATDFVVKPFPPELVRRKLDAISRLNQSLKTAI